MPVSDLGRSFLLVPAGGAGEGMGHLVRSLKLAGQLGSRVWILTRRLDRNAVKLLSEWLSRIPKTTRPVALSRMPRGKKWDVIIVDQRRTSTRELGELMERGLVACVDEGGEARDLSPYTVDALPGPPGRSAANLAGPSFLFLPRRVHSRPPLATKRILVSLGGEDKERLAERLVDAMLGAGVCRTDQVTVVEGPLAALRRWPPGVKVLRAPHGLDRALRQHDLLITHFGVAAFEALAAGIPAVLFNPTHYHATLGEAAGFASIGTGIPRMKVLKQLLDDPSELRAQVNRFNHKVGRARGRELSRVLGGLRKVGSSACPVCGRTGNGVIARFPDRTYRRCAECGVLSLESFARSRMKYDAGYFSSEYKSQYGRTYLEDFQSIKAACLPRVAAVRRLIGPMHEGVVLDVGCAYGPFLAALSESGLPGFGLDVSPGAVAYVEKKLGMPALCAGFQEVERGKLPRKIAAVTLWYVLEHFPDADGVLTKAAALLSTGGVLAFSTPNGRGISARLSLHNFLQKSPADHYTIFSPRKLKKILGRYELTLRRVRVTGHHPERFPGLLGVMAERSAIAARALRSVSVLFGLGDTFEAYAVKGES
jgi:2-polyprenyl-3-methyl-5-hydroxy-6-metoxy-1,4-benzoquinol methylase/spore coat polysaccharide biosynthesis predicted glycosyltransferase SpsG